MKKNTVINIAVMLVVTVVTIAVGQFLLNKYLYAMLIIKLAPFMKKWEGGLSRNPNDNASANPAPWEYQGKTGWHTNKGITYSTFVHNANRLGYAPTKENFFKMPDDLWLKILTNAYAGAFPLKEIAHLPRIQAVIITWAWGSGVGGAEMRLARFQREEMGIKDNDITPNEIVENFRRKINPLNEKHWFDKLCDRRLADLKKMNDWSYYGNGWTNRLNDFRKTFA